MKINNTTYEVVIGLEVHAQLLTKTKLFSGDATTYGAEPNTQVSPITLAHPGTLPLLNRKAVEYAIRLGLACGSSITRENYFARKNYFYPDLPKGYQISQHTTPVCTGGSLSVVVEGEHFTIELNRIHLEEDAGKSIHDADAEYTYLDYNRAGVALVEIVTEPCIPSADHAYAFLSELRKLVRYLGVCDGNMEEGSLRCDANISIRPGGDLQLGTKVEVKNLNSIKNVKKAIESETERMCEVVRQGKKIIQETRSFDAVNGTTFALRTKEEANDYRYFADPDISPFIVSEKFLDTIKKQLPELPEEKVNRYRTQMQLSEYDSRILAEEKDFADYFDLLAAEASNNKAAANWMIGPIRSWLNEHQADIQDFPLKPPVIAQLIALIDSGKINFSIASGKLFPALVREPAKRAEQLALELNLFQDSDSDSITRWVNEVLERMPEKVTEFKKGKKGLIGLFVGEVKKISQGKADPKITTDILLQKLQE
ncbi:MAG TPA: Asp-tRNA(Asn)/Glu-tRNA(Gln) amidotransferase subunit GatB [Flavitalea sp.]|nr:Asp-tRNA(Asn)/Glu-tRNA(Gln) amidotransferase subunit GatB [Flavitalea sp.]